MNVELLSDTAAPRYGYESDEEDQLNPLLNRPIQRPTHVSIQGYPSSDQPPEVIIIASGEAGKAWAQGAHLGEQRATVIVDELAVGCIFLPSWSDAAVIVSETSASLSTWEMHTYAEGIIGFFNPKRLLLLDIYSVPSYVNQTPLEAYRAPVRYLRTRSGEASAPFLVPFSPPNLIQATCAAFVSIAALPTSQMEAIVLLLPSPYISIPRGHDFPPSPPPSTDKNGPIWSETILQEIHICLAELSGMRAHQSWQSTGRVVVPKQSGIKRRGDIGDGGMYM
ncbi:hypothetical protein EDB84DRAFT_1459094 [Lactarius hengduanensis]|nr:hypothetical protein EDB84DRAFT_1459094 [Lactarius hengduanensis]